MYTIVLGLTDITTLCLTAIFFILFATIYKVIQEIPFFNSQSMSALLAFAVSLLSIIGMMQLLVSGQKINTASDSSIDKNTGLDFLLVPYIALGIAVIVMMILKFLIKFSGKFSLKTFYKKYPKNITKRTSNISTVVHKKDAKESHNRKQR